MTPRALLTAIGATALAFAIAIGVAADGATGITSGSAQTASSALEATSQTQSSASGAFDTRLAAWNDPCVIAV